MAVQEFEILSTPGIPEFRIVSSGTLIPYPVTESRSTNIKSYLRVTLPDDVSDTVWLNVRQCALIAAGIAAVGGAVTAGSAIIPAFMAAFGPCMAERGFQIASDALDIRNQVTHGDWHPV